MLARMELAIHEPVTYVALSALLAVILTAIGVASWWLRRQVTPESRAAAVEPDPVTGISADDWHQAIR